MRTLLIFIVLLTPLFMKSEEKDATKDVRISWAICPKLNMNIPGNWKSFDPIKEDVITYGGGIGTNCRIPLNFNMIIDADFSIIYDNFHIPKSDNSFKFLKLERWSLPISISLGYSVAITEDMNIEPLIGAEISYYLKNKVYNKDLSDYEWNRLNVCWCMGCGFIINNKFGIDLRGCFGLSRVLKIHNANLYNNKVRISIKYFL